ncbi:hypothetical protein, partial [Streptomyces sp. IGB124]|uniref:hypothetical protein n=1 Tax=Streptomyces sp. IGB124 TaxID=1519485 RepID=UPI001F1E11F5
MVEGVVQSFSPTGRITVDVLRTSRPRETGGTGRACYAVPAHSVTGLPAPASLRTALLKCYEGGCVTGRVHRLVMCGSECGAGQACSRISSVS